MIEAVIFDMDGVLADTEYYYENRRKNFLLENGIPIPEGNFIGSNEKAIWEAIVPNDPVRRQEMLMAYREYRKARPTPYGKLTDPQAEPLMNALRSRGLKVAVASSSAAPDIMKMLTEGGLKAMVDFAFSGEDCAARMRAAETDRKSGNVRLAVRCPFEARSACRDIAVRLQIHDDEQSRIQRRFAVRAAMESSDAFRAAP